MNHRDATRARRRDEGGVEERGCTFLMACAPRNYKRMHRALAAVKRRALTLGYEEKDPRRGSTLSKVQPLTFRRAMIEAEFLDLELREHAREA